MVEGRDGKAPKMLIQSRLSQMPNQKSCGLLGQAKCSDPSGLCRLGGPSRGLEAAKMVEFQNKSTQDGLSRVVRARKERQAV